MYVYDGRYSVVSIATLYGLDGPGNESRLGRGARIFCAVKTDPEVHPASCIMTICHFPGSKPARALCWPLISHCPLVIGLELYLRLPIYIYRVFHDFRA
jgi:hypothetical protein